MLLRVICVALVPLSLLACGSGFAAEPYPSRPIHWIVQEGVPLGSSAEDIDRLAEMGRRWLELAGVGRHDVVLGMLPPGPDLPYWELVLGCRAAGLSTMHLPPVPTAAQVAALRPTVLAGRPPDLLHMLEHARDDVHGPRSMRAPTPITSVRTVLTAGEPLDDAVRARLTALLPAGAIVLAAWAPPGVRSLWTECREGEGLHLWPDVEAVDVVDARTTRPVATGAGEIVWSALGWKGSALLRLRTGAYGAVERGTCAGCGRSIPRLVLSARQTTGDAPRDRRVARARG